MANKYIDTELLDRAIIFAVEAHHNTERRGKGFPYIVHPMEAVEIVSTITGDQELLAAAALHDTIEDTSVTYEQICERFGQRCRPGGGRERPVHRRCLRRRLVA